MDATELFARLEQNIHDVDKQIKVICEEAKEYDRDAYAMKYMDGQYVLSPLLTAYADMLSAQVTLMEIIDG